MRGGADTNLPLSPSLHICMGLIRLFGLVLPMSSQVRSGGHERLELVDKDNRRSLLNRSREHRSDLAHRVMDIRACHIRRTAILERPSQFLSQSPSEIRLTATGRPIEENSVRKRYAIAAIQF